MKDRVRLLGKTSGYTARQDRAMDPEEPEAVDAETQRRITVAAAESWPSIRALQVEARESQSLGRRIERAKAQARHLGVDVHQPLRLCRLAIENGRSRAHVERRIEAVESLLWPR